MPLCKEILGIVPRALLIGLLILIGVFRALYHLLRGDIGQVLRFGMLCLVLVYGRLPLGIFSVLLPLTPAHIVVVLHGTVNIPD